MSSIRIDRFAGMRPSIDPQLLNNSEAQIAHNCLLTDGSLRPLPQWVQMNNAVESIAPGHTNTPFVTFPGTCGIAFNGPPFGLQSIYLDNSGVLQPTISLSAGGSVAITPQRLSQKPVNRTYGVTALKSIGGVMYESAITVIQVVSMLTLVYEGDLVTANVTGNGDLINLYRSTSDVTAGAATHGATIANWQLVAQLTGTVAQYIDGGSAIDNPMDTYLYRGPTTPPYAARFMGVLESGYVWIASPDGFVALSDRFAWGYWPVENRYSLGSQSGSPAIGIMGAASVGDRIYLGTQNGCYVGEAHVTDAGSVVLGITPIVGSYGCMPNTMVATPTGVIYTSAQGVVALSGNQARMLSRELARGSEAGKLPNGTPVLFNAADQAFYHNGRYYAFGNYGLPPNLLLLTGHLPNGYVGEPGTYQYSETGGLIPYGALGIISGLLPPGATMNSTGLVTYNYTTGGIYNWTVSGSDAEGNLAVLPDGNTVVNEMLTNWTLRADGGTQAENCSACADGIAFIGRDHGYASYTKDFGVTWTQLSGLVGGWSVANAMKFNGSWYLLSNNVTGSVAVGDTFAFTSLANAPSVIERSIAILNNQLYAGAYFTTNSSIVRMNTPGAPWTIIDTGFPRATYGDVMGMCAAGSTYFFYTANGQILKTTDFITFELAYATGGGLVSIVYLASKNLVIAYSGDQYSSADLGVTWVHTSLSTARHNAATHTMIFGSDTAYGLYTSLDNVTWTEVLNTSPSQCVSNSSTDGTIAIAPCLIGWSYIGQA